MYWVVNSTSVESEMPPVLPLPPPLLQSVLLWFQSARSTVGSVTNRTTIRHKWYARRAKTSTFSTPATAALVRATASSAASPRTAWRALSATTGRPCCRTALANVRRLSGVNTLYMSVKQWNAKLRPKENKLLWFGLKMICNDFLVVKVNCWSYVFNIIQSIRILRNIKDKKIAEKSV